MNLTRVRLGPTELEIPACYLDNGCIDIFYVLAELGVSASEAKFLLDEESSEHEATVRMVP